MSTIKQLSIYDIDHVRKSLSSSKVSVCYKMLRVRFLNAVLSILDDRNSRSALFTTF